MGRHLCIRTQRLARPRALGAFAAVAILLAVAAAGCGGLTGAARASVITSGPCTRPTAMARPPRCGHSRITLNTSTRCSAVDSAEPPSST